MNYTTQEYLWDILSAEERFIPCYNLQFNENYVQGANFTYPYASSSTSKFQGSQNVSSSIKTPTKGQITIKREIFDRDEYLRTPLQFTPSKSPNHYNSGSKTPKSTGLSFTGDPSTIFKHPQYDAGTYDNPITIQIDHTILAHDTLMEDKFKSKILAEQTNKREQEMKQQSLDQQNYQQFMQSFRSSSSPTSNLNQQIPNEYHTPRTPRTYPTTPRTDFPTTNTSRRLSNIYEPTDSFSSPTTFRNIDQDAPPTTPLTVRSTPNYNTQQQQQTFTPNNIFKTQPKESWLNILTPKK